MFLMNYTFLFSLILFLFSFITINFNSLFFTWVFMELNLLMVSPILLMKSSHNKEQPSLLLKYFLVQVIASLFILSALTFTGHTSNPPLAVSVILITALMLKSGVPPLHFWFPPIVYLANPYQTFLLLCVQKVIPLFLMSVFMSEMILAFVVVSSLIGAISGLNQNSIMKVLAYSSMVHSAWMISGMFIKPLAGYFYFFVYTSASLAVISLVSSMKVYFISELVNLSKTPMMILSFVMVIFTLSGIPPFIGFFSKVYVVLSLMAYKFYLVVMSLVIGSSLSFFFYTRMVISMALFSFNSLKEKYYFSSPNLMLPVVLTSLSFLVILWLID